MGVAGREPDGAHHRLARRARCPNSARVLDHRRPASARPRRAPRSAAGPPGLLHEARLLAGRASAPPPPPCRARDVRRMGSPSCDREDPVAVVGALGLGRLHEGRLGEAISLARASIVSSPMPSASSTTARPLPARGRSAKTSSQAIRWPCCMSISGRGRRPPGLAPRVRAGVGLELRAAVLGAEEIGPPGVLRPAAPSSGPPSSRRPGSVAPRRAVSQNSAAKTARPSRLRTSL